jgi:RNA polymerase sigma-70 factor (ECF subfamily)
MELSCRWDAITIEPRRQRVESDPMPDGNSLPDADDDLLRRSAAGEEQAFAALYHRHHGRVYRFAMQMSGSRDVAEEVTQEVFLVLMHRALEFDPAKARLSSWLYGIARNQVLRHLERRAGSVALDDCEDAEDSSLPPELVTTFDPVESLTRDARAQRLRAAVLALPPRYREVVVLCELHEMSYAEAAAVTGCAVGTIRSRLHRSRALLHAKLGVLARSHAGGKVPQGR